jgi:hypothetical protein
LLLLLASFFGVQGEEPEAQEVQATTSPPSSFAPSADTQIVQYASTRNYGTATTLNADGDEPAGSGYDAYALVRFDLSGVPAGTKVTAATLRLNVTNATSGVYNLYALKRDWSEAQATWDAATCMLDS